MVVSKIYYSIQGIKKSIKYYIHLFLYFVIIVLLSISLTGPWIDTKADSRNGSISFQFNIFKVKTITKLNTLKILLDNYDVSYLDDDGSRSLWTKNNIDIIPNYIKNELKPIIIKVNEEFNKLNIENIRNEAVDKVLRLNVIIGDTITAKIQLFPKEYVEDDTDFSNNNLKKESLIYSLNIPNSNSNSFLVGDVVKLTDDSNIVTNNYKPPVTIKSIKGDKLEFDKPLGKVVNASVINNKIIKLQKKSPIVLNISIGQILKEINYLFNTDRPEDEEYFKNNSYSFEDKVNYVKSGELKKDIKKIQDIIRKYSLIIQIILIVSIILLGFHFLLVLFKGRRKGIFRLSGILTVFLPMLVIILFAVIFFMILFLAPKIMTNYYKLFVAGAIILVVTFILGLFKII